MVSIWNRLEAVDRVNLEDIKLTISLSLSPPLSLGLSLLIALLED
jgi:hypothetical protein